MKFNLMNYIKINDTNSLIYIINYILNDCHNVNKIIKIINIIIGNIYTYILLLFINY